ncbi:MAG: hypothetical protein ACOCZW_03105 [Bacteroidota bacterium]
MCANKLIDNSGSFVESVYKGGMAAGTTTMGYKNDTISEGLYFLILKWDGGITAEKLIIINKF